MEIVPMDEATAWDEIADAEYREWLDQQEKESVAHRLAEWNKEPVSGQQTQN